MTVRMAELVAESWAEMMGLSQPEFFGDDNFHCAIYYKKDSTPVIFVFGLHIGKVLMPTGRWYNPFRVPTILQVMLALGD